MCFFPLENSGLQNHPELSCCDFNPSVSTGQRDAEDEGLQRGADANADHGAVHGGPTAGAVEAAGDRHDRQIPAAVGRAR